MYYKRSPPTMTSQNMTAAPSAADDNMNLLISPFEPFNVNDMNQISYNNAMPMQQSNTATMQEESMSPIPQKFNLYEASPPLHPHYEMMNQFTNDFISRSPESSSSSMNDSNVISPPTHFYSTANNMNPTAPANDYYSDYIWPDAFDHYSTLKRSSSVPPGFHKNKPDPQDPLYSYDNSQVPVYPMVPSQPPTVQIQQPQPQQHKVLLPIQIKRLIRSHQSNSVHKAPLDPEQHRRQLDEKLEKVNFDDITVAELKEMLRERGLSATGRKAELMNRLKEEHDMIINRKNGIVPAPVMNTNGIGGSASAPMTHRRVSAVPHNKPHRNPYNYYYNYHNPYATPPARHNSISTAHLNLQHQYENMADNLASSVPEHHTPAFYTNFHRSNVSMKPSQLRGSFEPPVAELAAPSAAGGDADYIMENNYMTGLSVPVPPQPQLQPHTLQPHHPLSNDNTTNLWDDHQLQNFLNQI